MVATALLLSADDDHIPNSSLIEVNGFLIF